MKLALVAVLLVFSSPCAWADACSGQKNSGGMLGSIFTKGHGASGALAASLAGNVIAQDMECRDLPYAARAYNDNFHGPAGRRYSWRRGPDRGTIVTNREYLRDRRLCRDFTQVVYRRGREFDRDGTACRRQDGQWEFV